jgi:hypothetical protein
MIWILECFYRLTVRQENTAFCKDQIGWGCSVRVGGLPALLNVIFVIPIVSIEKADAIVMLRYS